MFRYYKLIEMKMKMGTPKHIGWVFMVAEQKGKSLCLSGLTYVLGLKAVKDSSTSSEDQFGSNLKQKVCNDQSNFWVFRFDINC